MQYLSCEKNENRLKRPGLAHFLKKKLWKTQQRNKEIESDRRA